MKGIQVWLIGGSDLGGNEVRPRDLSEKAKRLTGPYVDSKRVVVRAHGNVDAPRGC